MTKITRPRSAARARERIAQIRQELGAIELLCSGTLLKRMKTCGSPNCRCAQDPSARHGPYYEWGHMHAGKLVHRLVSAEQAEVLRQAIANYRRLKKLLRGWETETERLIDAAGSQTPRSAAPSANPVRSCSKCPAQPTKRPRASASFLRRKVTSAPFQTCAFPPRGGSSPRGG